MSMRITYAILCAPLSYIHVRELLTWPSGQLHLLSHFLVRVGNVSKRASRPRICSLGARDFVNQSFCTSRDGFVSFETQSDCRSECEQGCTDYVQIRIIRRTWIADGSAFMSTMHIFFPSGNRYSKCESAHSGQMR